MTRLSIYENRLELFGIQKIRLDLFKLPLVRTRNAVISFCRYELSYPTIALR